MGSIGLVEKVSDTDRGWRGGVVDHARAEPDDAETYGEAAKLIPRERERKTRIGLPEEGKG